MVVDAHTIVLHLRELVEEQARSKRKLLFRSMMAKGTSLVQHALKMNGYFKRLSQLGYGMDHELSIDFILASLPDSFAQIVLNYRINNIQSTIPELIDLPKTVKPSL